MATITITVPDGFSEKLGKTPEERERFVLEALAIDVYRRRILSGRRVAEILDIAYVDLIPFMAERDIPTDGSVEDFIEGYNASREFSTRRR